MQYYVKIAGLEEGPFTEAEIIALHGHGKLNRSSPCRKQGENTWKTVDDFVPQAKWALSPTGDCPRLGIGPIRHRTSAMGSVNGQPVDYGLNAAIAGWVSVFLAALTGWLVFAFIFPIVAAMAGVATVILGRVWNGILIMVAAALIPCGYQLHDARQLNEQLSSQANKMKADIEEMDRQFNKLLPKVR